MVVLVSTRVLSITEGIQKNNEKIWSDFGRLRDTEVHWHSTEHTQLPIHRKRNYVSKLYNF